MTLPPLPSHVGKRYKLTERSGRVRPYVVVDEVRLEETGLPTKVNFLQRIRFEDDDREWFRPCYYIINRRGNWAWGQHATMLPACDFEALVKMATEKGWIGKGEQR
jgi:hypothetical protein